MTLAARGQTPSRAHTFTSEVYETVGGTALACLEPAYPLWIGICPTCDGTDYWTLVWTYQTQNRDYTGIEQSREEPTRILTAPSQANIPRFSGTAAAPKESAKQYGSTLDKW